MLTYALVCSAFRHCATHKNNLIASDFRYLEYFSFMVVVFSLLYNENHIVFSIVFRSPLFMRMRSPIHLLQLCNAIVGVALRGFE